LFTFSACFGIVAIGGLLISDKVLLHFTIQGDAIVLSKTYGQDCKQEKLCQLKEELFCQLEKNISTVLLKKLLGV